MRKRWLSTIGIVAALVGAVFTLQGIGVLGGSFMTGSPTWAVTGIALIAAGATAYAVGTRSP